MPSPDSCFKHYLVTTKHTHFYLLCTHAALDSPRIPVPESGSEASRRRVSQPIRTAETPARLTSHLVSHHKQMSEKQCVCVSQLNVLSLLCVCVFVFTAENYSCMCQASLESHKHSVSDYLCTAITEILNIRFKFLILKENAWEHGKTSRQIHSQRCKNVQ